MRLKNKGIKSFVLAIVMGLFLNSITNAQFYNGLQMPFGKNRVQYGGFFWSFYRFKNYDVYFNEGGKNLAQYVALYADGKISEIESFFNFRLERRLIFIVYNKLTDFRQSNIGLVSNEDEDNLGGVTRILDNKVFLYFEGNYKEFERQINRAIAETILKEMLVGQTMRDRVSSLNQLNLPEWYLNGLISFMADEWNFNLDDKLRDGILSGKYKKITRLTDEDAVIAGHSLWRYISITYGKTIISSIIYLTRVNKNANRGFYNVLGIKMRQLVKEWETYYRAEYEIETENKNLPVEGNVLKRPKKYRVYQNMKISPDGIHYIYSTNENGKYIIWLGNIHKKHKKKIFKTGYALKQINDYSMPALAWHPSGKVFAFIFEYRGVNKLYIYNLEEHQLISRNLILYDRVLGFDYSDSGTLLVLSAISNGKTDLFIYNIAAGASEQLTDDIDDDLDPRFVNNSNHIIFSSNRSSDTLTFEKNVRLKSSNYYHIFQYDFANRSPYLRRLTDNKMSVNIQAVEMSRDTFLFLSDENGIFNRYCLRIDSAISYIDTAVHYTYYTETKPLTNYSRNILFHDFRREKTGTIFHYKKKDRLFIMDSLPMVFINPQKTNFRLTYNREIIRSDSIREVKRKKAARAEIIPDSILKILQDSALYVNAEIDVNNYIFEREKRYTFDKNLKPTINRPSDGKKKLSFPQIRVYQTAFYINYFVNQIDYGYLNQSYQSFNGNNSYQSPDLNGMFKIGTNDLFEDYRIVGGVRLSNDLVNNEYMFSFENLKKQLDKQIVFHRQAITTTNQNKDAIKTFNSSVTLIGKYSFDQVRSLSTSISYRHDKTVFLSFEKNTLMMPDINNYWASIKANYVFDNVISKGLNLYNGTRYKIFAETYKQINRKNTYITILGADFRHYQRIHRDLIYAGRVAASTSIGTAHLLYYLGSVDNDIFRTRDTSNNITPGINYVFQTLATNIRGYPQNARAGTSFFVINNEIRWPIIRYFSNYPVSSKFWSNLQLIGFFDIGSAWPSNDLREIRRGPVKVIIDLDRSPVIAGAGYGLRFPVFGYFLRIDWGYGIENYKIIQRLVYLSLSTDF